MRGGGSMHCVFACFAVCAFPTSVSILGCCKSAGDCCRNAQFVETVPMSRAKAGNHNLCCLRYCNASSPFSVRNACRQAPCCPFLLNRFEVIAQILDALAHRGFIVIFEILEERNREPKTRVRIAGHW